MRREHGAVDELRLILGEHALEPEQERELCAATPSRDVWPSGRRELLERHVERPAPRSTLGERDRGILTGVHEPLADELFRAGISAELGRVAAARATEVDSAIEALDFETEPASKVASARLGEIGARMAPAGC